MLEKTVMAAACAATAAAALFIAAADAAGDVVKFPADYMSDVHYGTVHRGNIREELYTDASTIAAVKKGKPAPSGSVLTLADYHDDKLYRIVVMEKRTGWGSEYPPDRRTGEGEFAWFNPDQTRKADEDMGRCMACHRSQASQDFVWSVAQMKRVP
jgi:hypothetical protein